MFLDLRAKFQKLKKKTQNSSKKLKLWEDFAPPERPSGVIKKCLGYTLLAGVEKLPLNLFLRVSGWLLRTGKDKRRRTLSPCFGLAALTAVRPRFFRTKGRVTVSPRCCSAWDGQTSVQPAKGRTRKPRNPTSPGTLSTGFRSSCSSMLSVTPVGVASFKYL